MDLKFYTACFSLLILSLSLIMYLFASYYTKEKVDGSDVNLVVLIISAREQFDLRNAIRSTWLNDFYSNSELNTGLNVKHYFSVGSEHCSIPTSKRTSPLTCELFQHQLGDAIEVSMNREKDLINNLVPTSTVYGFSFRANRFVKLSHLGIDSDIFDKHASDLIKFQLSLIDSTSGVRSY